MNYKNLLDGDQKWYLSKGDYLIDNQLNGRGQDKFEGELIHFGSKKFPTWNEVIKYLI